MLRAETIDQIIAKRQPLAAKVDQVKTNLITLSSTLETLQKRCSELLIHRSEIEISKRLIESLDTLRSEIKTEIADINRLKTRFERKTLNIGVIGRARQGKSRLLRSLTGLSEVEIPDNRGGFCTGARSKICHDGSLSEFKAYFYSESEFLQEVIRPYYVNLSLGEPPTTLDQLKVLPALPEEKRTQSGRNLYGHLRKIYVENLDTYRLLFPQGELLITREQIRNYVTQDQTNEQGQPILNYLAVREVMITCSFPQHDIGKIALVDLPGLGDLNYVDAERLTNTLRQDVDFILFVRMPNVKGDDWQDFDVQLYEKAYESLKELPVRLWSMMILNWVKGDEKTDNRHLCESFMSSIQEKHIEVQISVICDCNNETDSQTEVLDPVLNYLMNEIEALDKQYAASCQERLEQLRQKVQAELENASMILVQFDQYRLFRSLFKQFWKKDLPQTLQDLIRELKRKRQTPEAQFEEKVVAVIKKCREETKLPSAQEIKITSDYYESYKMAYNDYLPKLRANLSRHFLSLDGQLQDFLESVKSNLADVLVEKAKLRGLSSAKGSKFFSEIAEQIPATPSAEGQLNELKLGFKMLSIFNVSYAGIIQRQLREYLDKLTPDASEIAALEPITVPQVVEQVLEVVKAATVSGMQPINTLTVEDVLAPLKQSASDQLGSAPSAAPTTPLVTKPDVAKSLQVLTISTSFAFWQLPIVQKIIEFSLEFIRDAVQSTSSLPDFQELQTSLLKDHPDRETDLLLNQIEKALDLLRNRTIDGCNSPLHQMLCEPNEVAYVMVREFVDRVLRAEGVETEWDNFLHREQNRMWDDLRRIETRASQQREWQSLIDAAKHANQPKFVQFLNE